MADKIQAIRGMNDILPDTSYKWRFIEQSFASCLMKYGYEEIRFPIVESTALFKRSIGEITDIVEKEMYTFTDLNNDSLSLRPEGTAGCLRACIEHGILYNQTQKLWYMGPMFRHERPQKGRYRQFHQFGVEAIGMSGVGIELELIALSKRLFLQWGIADSLNLEINTLGTLAERNAYKAQLIDYLEKHIDLLDEDSLRRLYKNPLRILDSKNPKMQELIFNAPKLFDSLCLDTQNHFNNLCHGLDALNISYTINPFLVRGLDYYSHTVFEWVTSHLGAQATVCAGGRYDSLVSQLGGHETSACGFAMGIERLLILIDVLAVDIYKKSPPHLFLIAGTEAALEPLIALSEHLRAMEPSWQIITNTQISSFKSQFKKADKSEALLALILGDEECSNQTIGIKYLRSETEQVTIAQSELFVFLKQYFSTFNE